MEKLLKRFEHLSLNYKLIILALSISFLSIIFTTSISFLISKSALSNLANDNLESTGKKIKIAVSTYSKQMENNTLSLATNRLTEGLFLAYESAFYGEGKNPGEDQNIITKSYNKLEEQYSSRTQKLVENYNLGNFHLATLDKQIIYSAKSDPAGNILGRYLGEGGALAKTKLETCVDNALNGSPTELFYTNYIFLNPINSIHSFLCIKVLAEFDHLSEGISKGDTMGVLITEVSIEHINKIVSSRLGMGETGQAYLVNKDGHLTSNMHLESNKYNVHESFKNDLKINSDSIELAFKGTSGLDDITDPLDHSVVSFHTPVKFLNSDWALLVEKQKFEIYWPIVKMLFLTILASLVIFTISSYLVFNLLKELLAPLSTTNDTLKGITTKIGEYSNKLNNSSRSLDNSSNTLANNLQKASSALQEIESTIQGTLKNVEHSTKVSDQNIKAAENGRQTINKLTDAIQNIFDQNNNFINDVNTSIESFSQLSKIIAEISKKTDIINDIVTKTQLLSFNASIEAARAGEHGKGFAIVAEEVGNLAKISGEAAEEIASMLNESIISVQEQVETTNAKISTATSSSVETVELGKKRASECDLVLAEILESSKKVSDIVSQIYSASKEQVIGVNSINKSMEDLNSISLENKELSTETSKIADLLFTSSKDLELNASEVEELITGTESDENGKVMSFPNVENIFKKKAS